jgi:hypothetical protein
MRATLLLMLMIVGIAGKAQTLEAGFRHPPAAARPWVFWYWMQAAVSKEGVLADLRAMKEAGIGGAYLMPIKGAANPPLTDTPVVQLSPAWWEMVRYAMQEADKLGLQLAMHACDGFAVAGGPWITPGLSMQKVTWSRMSVEGGKVDVHVPMPPMREGYYRDVAVYALPVSPAWEQQEVPRVTKDSMMIQCSFERPFTCRTIVVHAASNYQSQRLLIQVSDDGEHFRSVGRLEPPRHGWQDGDVDVTHTIPAVTARYFRFVYDKRGSEPGAEDLDAAKWKPSFKIRGIGLSAMPSVYQYEGKAGAVWRISRPTNDLQLPDTDCIPRKGVIDLSHFMDSSGHLVWTAPAGHWMILRMGHTSTGLTNATGGGGKGLECDKFDPRVVELQFDRWFGETIRRVGPDLAGKVLKVFHVDSWECGSQNWSHVFREEFRRRRGYDCVPWLPVMAGVPLASADSAERFLHDVRETIAELVVDNFYKPMARLAHEKGCMFSAESVAPTMTSDGMLHYQTADMPMGEFWLRSPTHDKPNDMLDAISGAHIYGKNIIQAEGFTALRIAWDEHPGMLKTLQDRNYALGINRLVFHVFTHNPWMNRKPGMTLDGIGTFLQRDQTWWKPGRAWVEYTQRCQWLLQQGTPVADIAVFTGSEVPRRSLLPEKLVAVLPGLFGEQRVRSEAVRLQNIGEPVTTKPNGVVAHGVNMADPADWIDPLHGYAYDCLNPDAIIRLGKVDKGRIVLPGGASYGVLVLPGNVDTSDRTVMERVRQWEQEGAAVVRGVYRDSTLQRFGILQDLAAKEGTSRADGIAYAHRTAPGLDIYFVSNQQEDARLIDVSLRGSGAVPELWDAVTGEIRAAAGWSERNGRTALPLHLPAHGSIFIVLRKNSSVAAYRADTSSVVLHGPWMVRFDHALGGPAASVVFDSLTDWSRHRDSAIRYYSGTAVYGKTFRWDGGVHTWIDLGRVANIATVKVNGMDCGVAWTQPYRVEITKALKKGINKLEIGVTNTWANRLTGDHRLPGNRRITWTTAPYHLDGALLEGGLLGEVRILNTRSESLFTAAIRSLPPAADGSSAISRTSPRRMKPVDTGDRAVK